MTGPVTPGMTFRRLIASRYSIAGVAILLIGVAIRVPLLNSPMAGYARNEDATAHVLATMAAYEQTSAKTHRFLPIFTLGARSDKYINDLPTASRLDKHGNVFYTSWPPGFFVFPYALAKALHVAPNLLFLRSLNMALQVLCCLLLACLCSDSVGVADNREARWIAGSLGFMLYAAAPEALKSHLFGYWAESLYSPILIGQIILFARNRIGPLFFLLALTGGLIDWTAYIANAGFFLAFVYLGAKERRYIWLAMFTAAANVLALILLFAWFTSVVPIHDLLTAQRHRAGVRMGLQADYIDLFGGYIKTLGPFLLLLFPLFLYPFRNRWWRALASEDPHPQQKRSALFFVALFPLAENLSLANHAANYSYDRLKLLIPVAIAVSFLVGSFPRERHRLFFLGGILSLSSIVAFGVYFRNHYAYANDPVLSFQPRFGALVRRTAPLDTLLFTTELVRGSTLYYVGRNIYSIGEPEVRPPGMSIEDFVHETLKQRGFTQGEVYLPSSDRRTAQIWYVPASIDAPVRRETVRLFP